MRVLHVGDQRDAARPEARIFLGAGNILAELGRELAVDGGDVYADLLEDAAVHLRHDASAARDAAVVGTLPGRAHEAAGRLVAVLGGRRQLILDRLEGGGDAVAQFREPR